MSAHNAPLPDYAITHGHGQQRDATIVLLHGAFGAKEYWRYQTQALARAGYRVLAWDAPGYGLSPLPPGFDIDLAARSLEKLLRKEGGKRNIVLGHSMGGMIAQRAFAFVPELIHGYVFSATSAAFGSPDGEWQKEFVRARVAPLDAGRTIPDYAPEMLRKMMAPGAAGDAVELVIGTVSQMREETFRAAISSIVGFEGRALLPTMNVPALCIAGELDATAPAAVMEKMAAKMPQAEFEVLKGAGHFGWAENVTAFNALLLDFLKRRFGDP